MRWFVVFLLLPFSSGLVLLNASSYEVFLNIANCPTCVQNVTQSIIDSSQWSSIQNVSAIANACTDNATQNALDNIQTNAINALNVEQAGQNATLVGGGINWSGYNFSQALVDSGQNATIGLATYYTVNATRFVDEQAINASFSEGGVNFSGVNATALSNWTELQNVNDSIKNANLSLQANWTTTGINCVLNSTPVMINKTASFFTLNATAAFFRINGSAINTTNLSSSNGARMGFENNNLTVYGNLATSGNITVGDTGIAAPLTVRGFDANNFEIARFYSNTGTRGSFVIRNGVGPNPSFFIGTGGAGENLGIGTNGNTVINISPTGYVAIGSAPSGYKFNVTGEVNAACFLDSGSVVAGTCPSDSKLKTQVADVTSGLQVVNAIRPVSFEYKEHPNLPQWGFIAEEVQPVMPSWVSSQTKETQVGTKLDGSPILANDTFKTVKYGLNLQMTLWQAVRELSTKLDKLCTKHPGDCG